MPIKAIIFDFDGVIKNSTAVKKEAFRALYEEFGQKFGKLHDISINKALAN